jgi:hypothetical protein
MLIGIGPKGAAITEIVFQLNVAMLRQELRKISMPPLPAMAEIFYRRVVILGLS